ncbi:MAG TPA: TIGR00725 family protein, partial [Thermoplasmatales archaeon]|nr:TIGR00725 family protein [Thermoplasmatales archaeon]
MKKLIAVCGSDGDDVALMGYALKTAEKVGELIAERGAVLVCGGRGGIMEAACRGAKRKNGITVGILPESKNEANVFVDIPIETHLGNLRNYLVVRSADAVIAIGGRWGTLNEISFAMILGKPLILIKNTGGCVENIIDNKILQNVESH